MSACSTRRAAFMTVPLDSASYQPQHRDTNWVKRVGRKLHRPPRPSLPILYSGAIIHRCLAAHDILHQRLGITLEVQLDGFAQVGYGFGIGRAIADNIKLQATGDEHAVLGINLVFDFIAGRFDHGDMSMAWPTMAHSPQVGASL